MEDIIDSDNIYVAVPEKSKIFTFTGKAPDGRSKKQTEKISEQELELPKALTQRLSHSPFVKDDNILYRNCLTSKLRTLLRVQEKD